MNYWCKQILLKVPGRGREVHKIGQQRRSTVTADDQSPRSGRKVSVSEFVKAMKRERKTISRKDDASPVNNQSQIHGVCLQMIAGGLLALKVRDPAKVGTDKLSRAHLCVTRPNKSSTRDGNTLWAPAYIRDEC